MSLLKNLKTDESIKGQERDSLGGGVLDSDIYAGKIATAYVTKSTGGAIGLVLGIKTDSGREVRETLWMTNKNGQNFYEKNGEKNYLPGFNMANAISLLTVGKEIGELNDPEQKVINVYSFEAKAEVPTKVDMLMDLVGQELYVGVLKEIVDKTQKNEQTGEYVPTGETREQNTIDKVFRAKDKMTVAEIRAQAEEATFFDKWLAKNKGQVKNNAKGATGTAGAPKKAGATAGTEKPKSSLFGG